MSGIFLRFKRRLNLIRLFRALMVGATVGLTFAGAWLILWKLAVIEFAPIFSLYIGLGSAMIAADLTFLFSGKRDIRFAQELDEKFGLKARVQTMIEYMGKEGELLDVQREDADRALSSVPLKKYKFKGLWIYVTALVLSVAVVSTGFILQDVRSYVPPEEIIPFELTPLQENGLNNLIKYVEGSGMEEEFRTPLVDELKSLIVKLKAIDTYNEMRATLNLTMTKIRDITYESSTATEMLNALWSSDDIYLKHLALTLDTSDWSEPDWGDFAEKLIAYEGVLMGEDKKDGESTDSVASGKATLKFALESMSRKLEAALDGSGLGAEDEIYSAIDGLFNRNPGGFAPLLSSIDYVDDTVAKEMLNACLTLNSNALYDAIVLNKVNANVGEYAMMRLASLFVVPMPELERPELDGLNSSNQRPGSDNSGGGDGGVGGGETYGSNDLVLDPLTGKLVEYGKLFGEYNARMEEKLANGSYTEEQKAAIREYFKLLFSGIEEKEGN